MLEPLRKPKARVCACCGKPQDEHFRPFCSKRCADLDLGKWLNGEYKIPGGPPSDDSPESPDEGDA